MNGPSHMDGKPGLSENTPYWDGKHLGLVVPRKTYIKPGEYWHRMNGNEKWEVKNGL